MGRYSYWMKDLESVKTADDAARMLGDGYNISIDMLEDVWAVCDRGRPQFWMASHQEAADIAERPGTIAWDIEYFTTVWRVMTGDQYIFTCRSRAEAEGFVLGMVAHMHFQQQEGST